MDEESINLSENTQNEDNEKNENKQTKERLIQYLLVRSDLSKKLHWPMGAIVAQACHASIAVIVENSEDEDTKAYLNDISNMHKVVLQVSNENDLKAIAERLNAAGIKYKLWIEKPENIATVLALKPYARKNVCKFFRKLKLLK